EPSERAVGGVEALAFVQRLAADPPGVQRQERVDAIGLQRRIDRRRAQQVPFVPGIAGLLQQRALYSRQRLLALVDRAGWKLRAHAADGVPVLVDQYDVEIGGERDHVDPVRIFYDRAGRRRAQPQPLVGHRVGRSQRLPWPLPVG